VVVIAELSMEAFPLQLLAVSGETFGEKFRLAGRVVARGAA
jgi:hypothetical protein